jgi:hypothetical protein
MSDLRFTTCGLRFAIYDLRFAVCGLGLKIEPRAGVAGPIVWSNSCRRQFRAGGGSNRHRAWWLWWPGRESGSSCARSRNRA